MSSKWHGTENYGLRVCSAYNGTKQATRKGGPSGRPPLLSDAQILELRALHDFASWGERRLMARYGVDAAAIGRILSGVTRSRLVATRKHLPADLEAA